MRRMQHMAHMRTMSSRNCMHMYGICMGYGHGPFSEHAVYQRTRYLAGYFPRPYTPAIVQVRTCVTCSQMEIEGGGDVESSPCLELFLLCRGAAILMAGRPWLWYIPPTRLN